MQTVKAENRNDLASKLPLVYLANRLQLYLIAKKKCERSRNALANSTVSITFRLVIPPNVQYVCTSTDVQSHVPSYFQTPVIRHKPSPKDLRLLASAVPNKYFSPYHKIPINRSYFES